MRLRVKLLNPECKPYKAHRTDSGFDLRANIEGPIVLRPFDPEVIGAGIAIELPPGYEGQIRPRSGLSRAGILVPLGTIDNGYRGELCVTVINLTQGELVVRPRERIAQLVIASVARPAIEYVEALSDSERGAGGFGSTGVA